MLGSLLARLGEPSKGPAAALAAAARLLLPVPAGPAAPAPAAVGQRLLSTAGRWFCSTGWGAGWHLGSGGGGGGAGISLRRQGEHEPWLGQDTDNNGTHESGQDLGWLYSLHATELKQQHFLRFSAAPSVVAGEEARRAKGAVSDAAFEAMTAQLDVTEVEATGECSVCGPVHEADFYEGVVEFQEEHQLVLRSTWICAGAGSLAAMRERLEERVRFLSDLEADGWQLEAPVDDEFACLRNPQPKPPQERRLSDAWEIVEHWEHSVEWERWPGPPSQT